MVCIIVEGCDNTGKSTLVQKLHEKLDAPTIKPPSYNKIHSKGKGAAESYVRWLIGVFEQSKTHDFIFDRHPIISTPVYEPILFGDNKLLSNTLWFKLCKAFAEANPTIIYCKPADATIKNFSNKEQMEGVIEHVDALIWRYDVVMSQLRASGYEILNYDWEKGDDTLYALVALIEWQGQKKDSFSEVTERCLTYFFYCYFPAKISMKINERIIIHQIIDLKINPKDLTCLIAECVEYILRSRECV